MAFLLNLFLIIGNVAFAGKSCDIYLVETKMLDLPQRLFVHNQRVLIHQGLRFVDKEGEVECHFTPKGLQTCGRDCYITNDNEPAKYLRTRGIAKNHPSSNKDHVQWCQNWAKGKKYILTGYNC